MRLTHNVSGDALDVTFRPLQRTDVGKAIDCIRDAYGDTYVKPYLYTEEVLWSHHQSNTLSFSVAESASGDIVGIIASEVSSLFPDMAEIACQIILHDYGGYGLALPLALHQMEQAEKQGFGALFARALGCHLISQRTLEGMGFTHCGFLLSVFDRAKLTTRYHIPHNAKIHQTVAVKRGTKCDAGPIFLPEGYLPLASTMYQSLGMSWSLMTGGDPEEESLWIGENDVLHRTLLLRAARPGCAFSTELAAHIAGVARHQGQTVNLLLNLSCLGSGAAFRSVEAQGFFFTGFLPCCGDGEYMILHHPMGTPTALSQVPYLPAYEPYAAEIRRQCNG